MTTLSSSYVTNSLPQADRIVDQLMAADYSAEEISVLKSAEGQEEGSEHHCSGGKARNILVSVHLKGGCGMGRAEEIFGRARSEVSPQVRIEDERPQSWAKPLFADSVR